MIGKPAWVCVFRYCQVMRQLRSSTIGGVAVLLCLSACGSDQKPGGASTTSMSVLSSTGSSVLVASEVPRASPADSVIVSVAESSQQTSTSAAESSDSAAAGMWFESPGAQWSVMFPAEPRERRTTTLDGEAVVFHQATVDGDTYIVSNRTDDPAAADLAAIDLDEQVEEYFLTPTQITTEIIEVGGFSARQFTGHGTSRGEPQVTTGIMVVTDDDFIQIVATDTGDDDAAASAAFLDSFQLN